MEPTVLDDAAEAESLGNPLTGPVGGVAGLANLYVNDASLLPVSPAVDPQRSVMAFALRNAVHFEEQQAA